MDALPTSANRDAMGSRSFRWRSLTPSQAQAIAYARHAGVDAGVLAKQYGVSARTIYRAAEYGRASFKVVRLAGWWAEFCLTHLGPMRMTPWYADSQATDQDEAGT